LLRVAGVCPTASSEWSQPTLTGPSPPLRSGHSLVYDARRHRVLLYGGQQLIVSMSGEMEMKFMRDVWSLDCSQSQSHMVEMDGRVQPLQFTHPVACDYLVAFL